MKKCWLLFLVLSCTLLAQSKDWTQYVNPLMGTQSSFELSTGNTYPAIARPWGMNFWTPQTGPSSPLTKKVTAKTAPDHMSTSEAFAPSSDDKYTGKNGVIIVNDISIRNALATKIVSVTTHGTRTPPSLGIFKDYALEMGDF